MLTVQEQGGALARQLRRRHRSSIQGLRIQQSGSSRSMMKLVSCLLPAEVIGYLDTLKQVYHSGNRETYHCVICCGIISGSVYTARMSCNSQTLARYSSLEVIERPFKHP